MAKLFEIGLTMAGAVSAGAYTAGVMDFLIEALEAYSGARKKPGWDGPTHDVRIPIMSGASAGGMTSSICAIQVFRAAFDHVWPQDPDRRVPDRRRNRLYSSWVEDIDIRRLLETSDIDKSASGAPVRSLLCCDVIDKIVAEAFDLEGDIRAPEWIGRGADNSLRLRLTLTNLRGVPYAFDIYGAGDPRRYGMLNHGDLLDFKIGVAPAPEPGVYALDVRDTTTAEWDLFRSAAKATGAFPFGLAPRRIKRDSTQYDHISRIRYGDGVAPPEKWIETANPYDFVAVDGGTIDNEPLEMTRRFLSGGAQIRNDSDGIKTDKAVVLIAPFPNLLETRLEEVSGAPGNDDAALSLAGVSTKLLSTLINQARFKPDELRRASDEEYYSRYLISPARESNAPLAVRYPIACGAMGGFSGFLHRSFRRHDYLLGRRNAQAFLRWHFVLPEKAELFSEFHGDREKWLVRKPGGDAYVTVSTQKERGLRALPIIPLVEELTREIVIPSDDLPDCESVFGPRREPLDDLVKARAARVVDRLVDVHLQFGDSIIGGLQRWGAKRVGAKFAADRATRGIAKAVDDVRKAFYAP